MSEPPDFVRVGTGTLHDKKEGKAKPDTVNHYIQVDSIQLIQAQSISNPLTEHMESCSIALRHKNRPELRSGFLVCTVQNEIKELNVMQAHIIEDVHKHPARHCGSERF